MGREEFVIMLLLKAPEHRPPDPAPAVVRSKFPIGHNEHAGVRLLHHHLAGRDEDTEINDCCLRPTLKPIGNHLTVFPVHKVKFPVFCGATGTD